MHRYGGGASGHGAMLDPVPLVTAWPALHAGSQPDAIFDERFFEPIGYSSNAVAGKYYTTVHITPQPGCCYLSVETSLPLRGHARAQFVEGARSLGGAGTLAVTEIAIGQSGLQDAALDIPRYELRRSSQSVSRAFAVAHHHFERQAASPGHTTTTPSPTLQNDSRTTNLVARPATFAAKACKTFQMRREMRMSSDGDGREHIEQPDAVMHRSL
mmetsp:Transcript_77834/g.225055  ORF Transcript_77834/g.225055 Transcript_77834/m.225055 type:complete len:214 (-) Transcript_77834:25-666(-)